MVQQGGEVNCDMTPRLVEFRTAPISSANRLSIRSCAEIEPLERRCFSPYLAAVANAHSSNLGCPF